MLYSHDLYLRKYGTSDGPFGHAIVGAVLWTRRFGAYELDERPGDVAVSGSALYAVGSSAGALGLGVSGLGGWDGFIRKYNLSGTLIWTQFIGTSADDFANDVAVDASGNVYVVGTTAGSLAAQNGGGSDIFIRKYSSGGLTLWTRQLHYSISDHGQAVSVSGSSVYLAGGFIFGINANPQGPIVKEWDADIRAVKFTTSGTKVWDYGYGPISAEDVSDASADASGNLYIVGQTTGDFGGTYHEPEFDGYVVKLNANGSIVWGKQFGGGDWERTGAVLAHDFVVDSIVRKERQLYAGGPAGTGSLHLRRLSPTTGNTIWIR